MAKPYLAPALMRALAKGPATAAELIARLAFEGIAHPSDERVREHLRRFAKAGVVTIAKTDNERTPGFINTNRYTLTHGGQSMPEPQVSAMTDDQWLEAITSTKGEVLFADNDESGAPMRHSWYAAATLSDRDVANGQCLCGSCSELASLKVLVRCSRCKLSGEAMLCDGASTAHCYSHHESYPMRHPGCAGSVIEFSEPIRLRP